MPEVPLFLALTEPPAAALSVFLVFAVLSEKSAWRDHRAPLAAFFALNAIFDAVDFAAEVSETTATLWAAGLVSPLVFLLGPLIYGYVRMLTEGVDYCALRLQRHFWAAPIGCALMTPFYLLSTAEKNALVNDAVVEPSTHVLLAGLGGFLVSVGFVFHALAYLAASFRRLLRHELRVRDLFSNIEDKTLGWLRTLLLVLSVLWLFTLGDLVFTLAPGPTAERLSDLHELVFGVAEPIWIFALGILGLRQRAIGAAPTVPAATPSRPTLPDDEADRILTRLDAVMAEQRLFLRPNLTLRDVAQAARASDHHLSEALNRRRGVKFYDLVNRLRVEAAAEILRDDADATALDAMIAVGFNARSTFNAAFKKAFAQTPSAYRAAARRD